MESIESAQAKFQELYNKALKYYKDFYEHELNNIGRESAVKGIENTINNVLSNPEGIKGTLIAGLGDEGRWKLREELQEFLKSQADK